MTSYRWDAVTSPESIDYATVGAEQIEAPQPVVARQVDKPAASIERTNPAPVDDSEPGQFLIDGIDYGKAGDAAVQEDDSREALWMDFQQANAPLAPDRQAEVFRVQAALLAKAGEDIPLDVISENFDEWQGRVDVMDAQWETTFRDHPNLREYLRIEPQRQQLIADDLRNVDALSWALKVPFVNMPKRFALQEELYAKSFAQFLSRDSAPSEDVVRVNEELAKGSGADNWFSTAYAGSVNLIPMLTEFTLAGGVGAKIGAAIAAPGAAAAGAVTGGAGFVAGEVAGAAAGAAAGVAALTYYQTVGPAYIRLIEQGISPDIAATIASSEAAVTGTLFGVGMPKLLSRLGIPAAEGIQQLSAGVAHELEKQGVKKILVDTAKKTSTSIAHAAMMMGAVSGASEAHNQLARGIEFGETPSVTQLGEAVGEGIKTAVVDFTLISAIKPFGSAFRNMGRAYRLSSDLKQLEAIYQGTETSKLLDRNPDQFETLMSTLSQRGLDKIYSPIKAFDAYWSDRRTDPREMASRLFGDNGKAYDRATINKSDLEIPISRYLKTLGKTEHLRGLSRDVKVRHDSLTPRQEQSRIENRAKELADAPDFVDKMDEGRTLTEDFFRKSYLRVFEGNKKIVDPRLVAETTAKTKAEMLNKIAVEINNWAEEGTPPINAWDVLRDKMRIEFITKKGAIRSGNIADMVTQETIKDPAALAVLNQHFTEKLSDPMSRARELYIDPITGALSALGDEVKAPDPDRPMRARFDIEGFKATLNDQHGHETGDAALRAGARALTRIGITDGAKRGGSIEVDVRDSQHAKEIAAEMEREIDPGGRIRVTEAVVDRVDQYRDTGETLGVAMKVRKAERIEAGEIGEREGPPVAFIQEGVKLAFKEGQEGIQIGSPEGRAIMERVKAETSGIAQELRDAPMLGAVEGLPETALRPEHLEHFQANAENAFDAAYRDPSGLFNGLGFRRAQELAGKAYTASMDFRNFKAVDTIFKRKWADALMAFASRRLADWGGGEFDAARKGGDEFAMQHNAQEKLRAWLEDVSDQLRNHVFYREFEDGSVAMLDGLYIAYGIGKDFKTADGVDLPRFKSEQRAPVPEIISGAEFVKRRNAIRRNRPDRELVDVEILITTGMGADAGREARARGERSATDVEAARTTGLQGPDASVTGRGNNRRANEGATRRGVSKRPGASGASALVDSRRVRNESELQGLKPVRKRTDSTGLKRAWSKEDAIGHVLDTIGGQGESPTAQADATYLVWLNSEPAPLYKGAPKGERAAHRSLRNAWLSQKPGPSGGREGGHFDAINNEIRGFIKGEFGGVSGVREAFDLLVKYIAKGDMRWDRLLPVIELLRTVPGMEKVDLPPRVLDKIADAKWVEQYKEQAEGLDESTPASLKQGDVAREAKDLIVQHNLSSENLIAAAELGGLAAPSIAVTKGGSPLEGFGEITLLADKNLVDPQKGTPVSEFQAAIIPVGADQKALQALKDAGVRVEFYAEGKRDETIASVSEEMGLLFQKGKGGDRGSVSFEIADGSGRPRRYTIDLEGADETTAMHESFHVMTEVLHDVATGENAPKPLVDAYAELIKWMGHESPDSRVASTRERLVLERISNLSPKEAERLRELAAREERAAFGFEQYLSEGKAPSARLENVFSRFAGWMVRVYQAAHGGSPEKQFRSQYGESLNLTPKVRSLFDRLLATEEQINRTKEAYEFRPIQAALDAMTKEEREEHDQLAEESKDRARHEVLLAIARDSKKRSTLIEEERAVIEEEVARRVDSTRPYRALGFLQDGMMLDVDGNHVPIPDWLQSPDGKALKLDRKAVDSILGKKGWRTLPARTTAKEGVLPDDLASLFGFDTGLDLIRNMQKVEPRRKVINREVQEEILERFGPSLVEQPEQMFQKAFDGADSSNARRILLEIRALRRKVDPLADPRAEIVTKNHARVAAEAVVNDTLIGKLRPGLHRVAEQRASKRAFDAAADRKLDVAMAEREAQLISQFMYRFSREAKERSDSLLQQFKKKNLDSYRSAMGKAVRVEELPDGTLIEHREFLEANDAILNAIGVREQGPASGEMSIEPALQRMESEAMDIVFDDGVVERIVREQIPFKELTIVQAEELNKGLQNIRGASNSALGLIIDGKRVEFDLIADDLIAGMERLPDLGPVPASKTQVSPLRRAKLLVQGIDGGLLDPMTWIGFLGEASDKFFVDRYFDAREKKDILHDKVMQEIFTAWKELPKKFQNRRHEVLPGLRVELPIDSKKMNMGDETGPRDRQWLWMAFLNFGTTGKKGSRIRSLNPFGWEESQMLDAFGKYLSVEETDFLQKILNVTSEELWPAVAEKETRKTGLPPEKLDNAPIEIRFADGSEKVYPGGYFPARYRRNASAGNIAERQAEASIDAMYGNRYERPRTANGYTRKRSSNYTNVIDFSWAVVNDHLGQVVHDIAFDEYVRDTARILLRDDVRDTIYRRLGSERSKQAVPWLKAVANANADSMPAELGWWGSVVNPLKMRAVAAAIGGSVRIAMGDLTNAGVAVADGSISARQGALAYSRSIVEFGGMLLGRKSEWRANALELSQELRNRSNRRREVRNAEIRRIGKNRSRIMTAMDRVIVYQWALMEAIDAMVSTQMWWAAYNDGMIENIGKSEAIRRADKIVHGMLPTHNVAEQPALLRDKRGIGLLLIFHGYFNRLYNRSRRLGNDVYLKNEEARRGERTVASAGLGTVIAAARLAALFTVAGPMAETLSGRGKEDDETVGEFLARTMLGTGMASLPFGGAAAPFALQAVGVKTRKLSVRAAPALGLVENAATRIGRMASDDRTDDERVWDAIELFLISQGGPSTQVRRSGEYIQQMVEGDVDPTVFEALKGIGGYR